MALDPITGAETLVQDALDKFVPDPVQKAAAQAQLMTIFTTQMQLQASVITAGIQSGGMEAKWRPLLMFTFMAIIINNYIIAPYAQAMFSVAVSLPLPPDMWALLKIAMGGYVMGRTIEKSITPHPSTGVSPVQSIINTFKGGS
jgi:Holin of 3TMs, for gene-transfer release